MTSLPFLIKGAATIALLVIMLMFLPAAFKEVFSFDFYPKSQQTPKSDLSITVAQDSVRIAQLEKRVQAIEDEKIGETLAEIKMAQKGLLALLCPIALFIFTATWENIQRLRGKTLTRSTDVEPRRNTERIIR